MLIVIEGIDGSGKGTQANALATRLKSEGRKVELFQFPQYDKTFFGQEVGRYLDGEFGTLETVPVKFSSLLYALDRFQSRDTILSLLADDYDVICDRYTGSNIAHQVARVPAPDRLEMIDWINHVERSILKIPDPDLVIFLDMDVGRSQDLVLTKKKRIYTDKSHDLHEASADHLANALRNFRTLALELKWTTVECVDREVGLKSPVAISEEVYYHVCNARSSI